MPDSPAYYVLSPMGRFEPGDVITIAFDWSHKLGVDPARLLALGAIRLATGEEVEQTVEKLGAVPELSVHEAEFPFNHMDW